MSIGHSLHLFSFFLFEKAFLSTPTLGKFRSSAHIIWDGQKFLYMYGNIAFTYACTIKLKSVLVWPALIFQISGILTLPLSCKIAFHSRIFCSHRQAKQISHRKSPFCKFFTFWAIFLTVLLCSSIPSRSLSILFAVQQIYFTAD